MGGDDIILSSSPFKAAADLAARAHTGEPVGFSPFHRTSTVLLLDLYQSPIAAGRIPKDGVVIFGRPQGAANIPLPPPRGMYV